MFGGFLDSMPSWLFIFAHLVFLGVGLWAVKTSRVPFLFPIRSNNF